VSAPPGRLIAEAVRPPSAITQFVLKVHSRCDLACDHCYVYEHADQSWRGRPAALGAETAARVADRIAEHAARYALPEVRVILHGGEPLLLGPGRMDAILRTLRAAIDPVARTDLRLHTNAVRLSAEFCAVFDKHGVKVGVSLDGDRRANDLHRRFADGRSSHTQVLQGLDLLRRPEYRHLYAGILCTVDTRNDPIPVYESLLAQGPPALDFLLPHATWAVPPARYHGVRTEYADWLLAIYSRWLADGRPVPIRTFASLERTARGGRSLTEALGAEQVSLVVIETDGTYEQVDSLKIAYPGAPETGFNVFEHAVDEITGHPGFAARTSGMQGLSAACRACPVVRRCGGGFYPHRYRPDNGFDNPSVYCEDLRTLVENIPPRRESAPPPGPDPLPAGGVPDSFARELVDGIDTAWSLRSLAVLQNRINRVVVAVAAGDAADGEPTAVRAWDALVRLEERVPRAAARVFDHPHLRVWAARLRAGGAGAKDLGPSLLEAMAVSAAVHSGQAERLTVRPRGREFYLPGLGTLDLPGAAEAVISTTPGALAVEADGGGFEVDLGAPDGPDRRWRPLTRLEAPGVSVTLDDADPYRDCYGWPSAERLDRAEAGAWRRDFATAVGFLDAHLPRYAAELRVGLRTIVPLSADPAGNVRSATAWNAFGAVGIARPADPQALALSMIHELQHVKLNALFDIAELYDKSDETLYYAPWRDEMRPLGQYFHGAFAHVAVTEYWHVQSRIRPPGAARRTAAAEFATWRGHTEKALETLLGSGRLTGTGRLLVERARGSIGRIPAG
jgi:uncharacterized protein